MTLFASISSFHPHRHLIVVTPAKDLLAVRSKQEAMLKLCSITALLVHQWWICLDNTLVDQVVQAQQVLLVAQTVEITTAEWKSAERFVDNLEDVPRRRQAEVNLWRILGNGVMRTFEL